MYRQARTMRIGYFGDGVWAHRALERIVDDRRFAVVFVAARNESPDLALKVYADRLNVPFLAPPDVNNSEFIETVRELSPELLVSMSFDQIVRKDLREAARRGFINCHAGALPFYRGRSVLNWAIINGEPRFGVTVHDIDDGIDTGDIIRQDWVAIEENDTYGTILEKAYTQCAETLYSSLVDIAQGCASRTPQKDIHTVGSYCKRRKPGDEWLDWSWSARCVHDFVRGISQPGPCARTLYERKRVAIVESRLIKDAPDYIGTPGEVVDRTPAGNIVKVGDSTILISKIADIDPADDGLANVRVPRFRVGTRFGSAGHSPSAGGNT